MNTSSRLTIFEGPDGAGKTTAALRFAAATGARYVHLGPLPQITQASLGRVFMEAMLPALLGHQPVVMDRCWRSELPYGRFHRGKERLSETDCRMLERVALRCQPRMVRCLPPWEVVLRSYIDRREIEYLQDEQTLRRVYDWYQRDFYTELPCIDYDYTENQLMVDRDKFNVPGPHPTSLLSAGRIGGVLLVGGNFDDLKNEDSFYQYPFVSFSSSGCSRWLTERLKRNKISEQQLCWVNADQDLNLALKVLKPTKIIALGAAAEEGLSTTQVKFTTVEHPQYWNRFHELQDKCSLITELTAKRRSR